MAERLWVIENQLDETNAKLDCLLKQPVYQSHPMQCSDRASFSSLNRTELGTLQSPNVSHQRADDTTQGVEPVSFTGLLPLPVLLDTIDLYFSCCHNQSYSFFHEKNFRQRLSDGLIPDHLLFAILASAVRFSSHAFFEGRKHEMAVTYANRSWRSIVSSCIAQNNVADITTVQTITLLAIFDFTAGHTHHGSAWVKIGLSVRIAQDLCLMIDPDSNTTLSPADQEERRRTFWSLYLLDRIVSCGRARPPAILEASCQLQLPCDEEVWRAGRSQRTDTLDQLSNKTLINKGKLGPFAVVIIMAYILSRGAQYMLQEYNIRSRDPPWDSNSDFASITSDLLYIESQFEMTKPIQDVIAEESVDADGINQTTTALIVFSQALFYLCHCLLNHPFLLRHRLQSTNTRAPSTFLSRSFDFGRICAMRLTRHLADARSAGCATNASFYGYCAVVAGTIQALYVHSMDETLRTEAMEHVHMNLATLSEIGKFWENVSAMSNALTQFSTDPYRFHILTSPDPNIPPLSAADQEIMWSLVDYSTMSSAVKVTQVYHFERAPPCDATGSLQSWVNLFSDANFQNQMDLASMVLSNPEPEHSVLGSNLLPSDKLI